MSTDRVLIRSRFWPRFLRWAVGFQLAFALLIGVGLVIEGIRGDRGITLEALMSLGVFSVVLAVLAMGIAFRRRDVGAADIIPRGIRPLRRATRWDRRYPWALIETVRVKAGPFGNRWLEVVPAGEPPFKLTARPHDPDSVLDALEHFAGPDHPLTQAYSTLLDK